MAKPPSWNEIRARATEFASRWADETDERAEGQTFWNEFFAIFGIDRRVAAAFEQWVKRSPTADGGFIDMFWPKHVIVEHKSAGKSLEDAEEQAKNYLKSVDHSEFPRLIVTSDFAHLRVLDLEGDRVAVTFPLTDLPKEIDRFGIFIGSEKREFSVTEEEAANVKAAKLMGRLYEELSRNEYEGHDASILLVRLLFLMFGDDTGMWEKDLFAEFVATRTQPDGTDLGPQLAHLFQLLDKEETSRPAAIDELLARFPYVNGHLFSERIDIPAFDRRMRDELVTATEFGWGKISPAVFGSLFQAIKSKEARRELGEHYTTESAIMKAIGPLFLDELEEAFIQAKDNKNRLEALHDRLANIRVLDPACGCGNFLVVAYRQLRRLELRVLTRLRELSGERQLVLDVDSLSRVRISQFFGIEIEEWPARIAETAMFLVDQQANQELARVFGRAPDRLPINIAPVIHMGNALRVAWDSIMPFGPDSFIVGNPPFGGSTFLTDEQRDDVEDVWGGVPGSGLMDYVSNWFLLAGRHMAKSQVRAALVSTNSITQGGQPATLWRELYALGIGIDFAHQTFAWKSEAPGQAAVHCVIIGFSSQPKPKKTLFKYPDITGDPLQAPASNINAYLLDAPNVLVEARRAPIQSATQPMVNGSKPTDAGHLSDISAQEADLIRSTDPVAAKYLRRLIGAQELIQGQIRYCLWLVDAPQADILSSPELRRRVTEVQKMRQASKDKQTQKDASTPYLFQKVRQPSSDFLVVPNMTSVTRRYIPIAWLESSVIVNNLVQTLSDASLYQFGVLCSSVMMTWHSAVSGRLKSDQRFSAEITYNNFPWPQDPTNKTQIETAAQAVIDARNNHPGASLADLYDPLAMPRDLVEAHKKLDREVLAAYGLKASSTESESLANLFTRYSALTADLLTEEKPKKAVRRTADEI